MEITRSSARPGAAAQPFYFGWRIVFAMFLVTTTVYGNTVFGFIILSGPLAQQFGWSATTTGTLVSALWLIAPLALFVAPVIERLGPKRLIIFGLVLQCLCLAALGHIGEFWHLYLLRLVMGVGKVVSVVAVPVMVSRWFSRRFGTAMALAWCGGSFGGVVMSPVAERLTAELGWADAALVLAGIVASSALAVILLCRGPQSPADLALALDGDALPAAAVVGADGVAAEPETRAIRAQLGSIRLATALPMAVAVMCTGAGALAMLSQAPTLLEAGGLSPTLAASLFGLIAGASMTGQIMIGWYLDRFRLWGGNLIVALTLLVGAVSFALLQSHNLVAIAAVAALTWGIGMGANEMLWIALTKRQFGARLFAYTYGAWSCALQAGYAIGGPIGGWTFEHSDRSAFPLLMGLLYLPAIVVAIWRPGLRNEA